MLKVEGLRAGYGAINILWDLSFTIGDGEIVAILGGNGAGKTTMVRAVTGMIRPSSGSVVFEGEELIGKPVPKDEMRKLCVAFREKSRDKMKVYDGVFEFLSDIKNSGGRIFLLSNAQRLFTEKELDDTGLTPYFDDIFISSDMGIKKPDGKFLEALIEKHGLNKEECVMIGNEEGSDGKVAIAAGIDHIIVTDFDILQKEDSK